MFSFQAMSLDPSRAVLPVSLFLHPPEAPMKHPRPLGEEGDDRGNPCWVLGEEPSGASNPGWESQVPTDSLCVTLGK